MCQTWPENLVALGTSLLQKILYGIREEAIFLCRIFYLFKFLRCIQMCDICLSTLLRTFCISVLPEYLKIETIIYYMLIQRAYLIQVQGFPMYTSAGMKF